MEIFNMENLDIIKEERFLVADKPWIRRFYPHVKDIQDDWSAECVYVEIDGEIRLIKSTVSSGPLDPEEKGKGFVQYLKENKPGSFKDILLLLDLYPLNI